MVSFRRLDKPSPFRKIAAAMWRPPNDPTVLGMMDLEASGILEHIKEYRRRTGVRVTVTHIVAQALALTLRDHPDLNAKVHWGRILLRESVDIFLQVATEGGRDLSGVKIEKADQKSLEEIAIELQEKSRKIREGRDPAMKKSRSLFRVLPGWLVRPMLRLSDLLVNEFHFDLSSQGMPRDTFGSAMVTSVGMFGIDCGFAPFTPIARCPIIVLVNRVADQPWVENGQLVVRPVLRLTGTFDHRVIDGYHAGLVARGMKDYLNRPKELDEMVRTGRAAEAGLEGAGSAADSEARSSGPG